VNQPPVFTSAPEPVEVKETEDTELVVTAEGKPCPQLLWYKEGRLIKDNGGFGIEEVQDRQVATGKLTLTDAQLGDEGKYSVKASNKAGSVKTEIPLAG